MTHHFNDDEGIIDEGGLSLRQKLNLAATAILGVALTLFIVQNTERENINFLNFDPDMPIWLLVLGSAAVGAALGIVGAAMWRRGRSKR